MEYDLFSFIASASLTYFFPLEADAYWIGAAGAFFISIMYLALALLLSFFGWRLVYLIMTTPVQVIQFHFQTDVVIADTFFEEQVTRYCINDNIGFNIHLSLREGPPRWIQYRQH
jgi:hypothetical protein